MPSSRTASLGGSIHMPPAGSPYEGFSWATRTGRSVSGSGGDGSGGEGVAVPADAADAAVLLGGCFGGGGGGRRCCSALALKMVTSTAMRRTRDAAGILQSPPDVFQKS